jgi:hypothetical protein
MLLPFSDRHGTSTPIEVGVHCIQKVHAKHFMPSNIQVRGICHIHIQFDFARINFDVNFGRNPDTFRLEPSAITPEVGLLRIAMPFS